MYIPDNLDAFDAYDAEQQRQLEKLPVCEQCGQTIQDDYYFVINDEVICTECLVRDFRKNTEDYIE